VAAALKRRLDALVASFDASSIDPDPLGIVRGYRGPDDLEVAGILCAGLAIGGVQVILRSARTALAALGPRPAEGLAGATDRHLRRAYRGFRHRWVDGDDLAAFLSAVRRVRESRGSLRDAFLAGDTGGEAIEGGMEALAGALRAADPGFARRGAAAFVPAPSGGSACKRPALFLRWMVRDDGIDTGAWKEVDPARLVLPLDTHLERFSRGLGLLHRRTPDWKAALEATAGFRRLSPSDPLRYDFALCRLGILDLCPPGHSGRCRAGRVHGVCERGLVPSATSPA